jgi:hypothetical protein
MHPVLLLGLAGTGLWLWQMARNAIMSDAVEGGTASKSQYQTAYVKLQSAAQNAAIKRDKVGLQQVAIAAKAIADKCPDPTWKANFETLVTQTVTTMNSIKGLRK